MRRRHSAKGRPCGSCKSSDNESARAVVTALGDAALVHFRDLKGETPMRRPAARRTEHDGYETLKLF